MVRSMYSGVTGMKSHQTRLDVIGNNIANVNTYGFKSSRATFRDVYYQNLRNGSKPTAISGGTNPSGVGYGATIGSIDLLMTDSAVTNTGNPMDVAINGDGFFQVQDADGNIFYTRAGMLDIDSDGNLVDMNGYFVLGVAGNPVGQKPSSNRINVLNSMGSVPATRPYLETSMNGVNYIFRAENATREGNVSLNFVAAEDMPYGQKAEAIVGTSTIQIRLNAKEKFGSLAELEDAINNAIRTANNGIDHPAGRFSIEMDPPTKFPADGLTGAEICGTNYGYKLGTIPTEGLTEVKGMAANPDPKKLFGGFTVKTVGEKFTGAGVPLFKLEQKEPFVNGSSTAAEFELSVKFADSGNTYTATLTQEMLSTSGSVVMRSADGDEADTITMTFPRLSAILSAVEQNADADAYEDTDIIPPGYEAGDVGPKLTNGSIPVLEATAPAPPAGADQTIVATPSTPSNDLGFSSSSFKLANGTDGGAVELKDLTGIIIGADGIITASHAILGRKEVGRIDLANFDNNAALDQSGNSYYSESLNSGAPGVSLAGTDGTGTLKTSSLEMSNVDLSQEFADMITTQRGFQANSRMITVSDTLLEELVNLKR